MKVIHLLLALALPVAPTATAQRMAAPSASLKNAPPPSRTAAAELYRAAEAAARRNEPRVALRQLKQAVASGFFRAEEIERNAGFTPLRNQPGWSRLLD